MLVKKDKFLEYFIGAMTRRLKESLRDNTTEMEMMLDARFIVTKEAGSLIDKLQKKLSNERTLK
jgi:hypothetical protein